MKKNCLHHLLQRGAGQHIVRGRFRLKASFEAVHVDIKAGLNSSPVTRGSAWTFLDLDVVCCDLIKRMLLLNQLANIRSHGYKYLSSANLGTQSGKSWATGKPFSCQARSPPASGRTRRNPEAGNEVQDPVIDQQQSRCLHM